MELHKGFFHKLNPKFLGVAARTINTNSHIILFFIRKKCINNYLCPWTIFKELKRDKSSIEVIFLDDNFLNYWKLSSSHSKSSNEPTGSKYAMFCIYLNWSAWLLFINDHKFRIFNYFIRSLPLQTLENHSPFWQICRVLIKLRRITRKLIIDPLMAWVLL